MSLRHSGAVVLADVSVRTRAGIARRSAVFCLALFSFLWLNVVAETHRHQPAASFIPLQNPKTPNR